jgi:hypothetical protein
MRRTGTREFDIDGLADPVRLERLELGARGSV